MIILFITILFSKKILPCNGRFRSFTIIKKWSVTSFWCLFSAWFFHKNVPYSVHYLWTKFQCDTFFPSQEIKQNVLLSSYWDNWWWHREREKEWRVAIQKFEYLENKKSFLVEIKRSIQYWSIQKQWIFHIREIEMENFMDNIVNYQRQSNIPKQWQHHK